MNRKLVLALGAAATLAACAKKETTPPAETVESAQAEPLAGSAYPDSGGLAPAVASPSPDATAPITPGASTTPPVSAPVGAPVAGQPEEPEVAAAGKVQGLTDAQIVKVTETVNSGEIEQAKLAKTKSKNPAVKKFATHMITEHTKANQEGKTLAKKQKIQPEDSPTAEEVNTKATATLETLKAADKEEFDRAYVDSQVQQHQTVLDMITGQLLPSASDEGLKAQLEKAKAMVESHLAAAKELQNTLASAPATSG